MIEARDLQMRRQGGGTTVLHGRPGGDRVAEPNGWAAGAHVNAYLPEQAGTLITHTRETSGDLLSPWQGFGVLCIWTVVALAAAAYLLERRDA